MQMRRRIIAFALVASLTLGLLPVPAAAVEMEPLQRTPAALSAGTAEAENGFLEEPSGQPPQIPASGFLMETASVLPTELAPGDNGLMREVGEMDPAASPVASAEELLQIQHGSYYLTEDIDLTGISDRIHITGQFTLDGRGHRIIGVEKGCLFTLGRFETSAPVAIRNLRVETTETGVSTAVLFNLSKYVSNDPGSIVVENCAVYGNVYASGVFRSAGLVCSEEECGVPVQLLDCAFVGQLECSSHTGGMVSGVADGLVEGCYVETDLTASSKWTVGGIVGEFGGDVRSCRFVGSITGGEYAGGIAGYLTGAMSNCTVTPTAPFSGSFYMGFAAGYAAQASDVGITTDQPISGLYHAGGLFGDVDAAYNCWFRGSTVSVGTSSYTSEHAGGLAGNAKSLSGCYSVTDKIYLDIEKSSALSCYLGGLVGVAESVTDCAASCGLVENQIASDFSAGGLVGKGGNVLRCYAQATVTAAQAGGIAGELTGTATDSFARGDISGEVVGGVVGEGSLYNCYYAGGSLANLGDFPYPESTYYLGGLAGIADSITACQAADMTLEGKYWVGGLAGSANSINGCIASGLTITGPMAGGLAGMIDPVYSFGADTISMTDCSASGLTITGSEAAGGLTAKGTYITRCIVSDTLVQSPVQAGGMIGTSDGLAVMLVDCVVAYDVEVIVALEELLTDQFSYTAGYAGGLVGCAGEATLLACESAAQVTGFLAGGLIGNSSTTELVSCRVNGRVEGTQGSTVLPSYAGGLAGYTTGVSVRYCEVSGTVTGVDWCAGLVGYGIGFLVEECHVTAALSGCNMGGLMGRVFKPVFKNSTFGGTMTSLSTDTPNGYVGGLAARVDNQANGQMDSCHVTSVLKIGYASSCGGLIGYIEGINGATLMLRGCTTVGMEVSVVDFLGGIVGMEVFSGRVVAENCTIYGDITASEAGMFGGFLGYIHANPSAMNKGPTSFVSANCWIEGDVVITSDGDYIGSHVGYVTGANSYGNCVYNYYNSGILTSASDPSVNILCNGSADVRVCGRTGSSYSNKVTELETYDYTSVGHMARAEITVYGGTIGQSGTELLAGALVTLGDYSAYTDLDGVAVLECPAAMLEEVSSYTVSRDGYGTQEFTAQFASNSKGRSVTLWRIDPGRIFIDGGSVTLGSGVMRDMFSSEYQLRFAQMDDRGYYVNAHINWNSHTPDKVYLKGETSGRTVNLMPTVTGAVGVVCFGEAFAADERIILVAVTEESAEWPAIEVSKVTSWRVKEVELEINVTDPNTAEVSGDKFFLDDMKIKVDLEDLMDCATSISITGGILSVTFSDKDENKIKRSIIGNGKQTFKDTVKVSGTLGFPIADPVGGKWSGKISVSVNSSEKDEWETNAGKFMKKKQQQTVHRHTFPFSLMGVPFFVETSLGVSGTGAVELYGNLEGMKYKGSLTSEVTGTVGTGVGGDIDVIQFNDKPAAELKVMVEGSAKGTIPLVFDTGADPEFSCDASITGKVAGKAVARVYVVGLEGSLDLGSFKWDKNGLVWETVLDGEEDSGETVSLLSDGNDWSLMGRDYLSDPENVSGFVGTWRTIYNNIKPVAELATGYFNYSDYLYYTAENTAYDEQNAMNLYCSMGNRSPIVVDDSETADYMPSADSCFVTWVDTKTLANADFATAMLASEIAVSGYDRFSGTFTEKKILTDVNEDSYVWNPVVTAKQNNSNGFDALVTWMKAPDVSKSQFSFLPDRVEIWYAVGSYSEDASARTTTFNWSEPVKAATVDTSVSALYARCDGAGEGVLEYQAGQDVFSVAITGGAAAQPQNILSEVNYYVRNMYHSCWQTVEGVLMAKMDGKAAEVVCTELYPDSVPVLSSNLNGIDNCAIFWAEGSSVWVARKSGSSAWMTPAPAFEMEGEIQSISVYRRSGDNGQPYCLVDTGTDVDIVQAQSTLSKGAVLSYYLDGDEMVVELMNSSFSTYSSTYTCQIYPYGEYTAISSVTTPYSEHGEMFQVRIPAPTEPGEYELYVSNVRYPFTVTASEESGITILDAYAEAGGISAYVKAYGGGEITAVLSDTQGNEVASGIFSDYESGRMFQIHLGEALPEGAYMLIVSQGEYSAECMVGVGNGGMEEGPAGLVLLDAVTTESGSVISLLDPNGLLYSGGRVYASQKDTEGRQTGIVSGVLTADGVEGVFTLTLSGAVTGEWTLYFLDSLTYVPVCAPLLVDLD